MKSVEKSARTVDEAIEMALAELDTSRDHVEIEVIDEGSKGIFGIIGSKDAVVKVTKKDTLKDEVDAFLTPILTILVDDFDYEVYREEDRVHVNIASETAKNFGIIIGKRGVTLDALQYLLSLAINKDRDEYLKVILDTENYRAKREKTLQNLAEKMARKAVNYRRAMRLEPMNPFERRIIHSSLQGFENVTTFSEGKEPYRRVVIQYEKDN